MTLASLPRRRQHVLPTSTTPSPSFPPLEPLDFAEFSEVDDDDVFGQGAHPSAVPAALDLSYCNPAYDDQYVDSRQSTPYDHSTFDSADLQLMTDGFPQNPRLFVQQSTPDTLPESYTPPPMNAGSYQPQTWNQSQNLQNWAHLNPNHSQHHRKVAFRSHKRLSSGSSTTSAGPDSPFTQTSDYPQIVDSETHSTNSPANFEGLEPFYTSVEQYTKSLTAPTHPLNNGALFNTNYTFHQPTSDASQYGGSPITYNQLQGGQGQRRGNMSTTDDFGEGPSFQQSQYEISPEIRSAVPGLDRNMSDACQDELFNPSMTHPMPSTSSRAQQARQTSQQQQQQQSQASLLSPTYRSTLNDLKHAANAARSASPVSGMSRERSPFRDESSEYVNSSAASTFSQGPNSPARINSAAQIRAQQKLQSDAQAYAQHHPPPQELVAQDTTVSPKETYRDYNEPEDESKNFALFPPTDLHHPLTHPHDNNASAAVTAAGAGPTAITTTAGTHPARRPNTSAAAFGQQYGTRSGPSDFTSQPANSNDFSFMAPSVSNVPQQYPFISHSRRQSSSMRSQNSDQILEFPATLSSMESTKSETGIPETVRPAAFLPQSQPSSQEMSSSASPPQRPADTSAHSNTYICTTPNCTARFDSSMKLHKHRRDVHRAASPLVSNATTSSPATPSSSTSANPKSPSLPPSSVSRNNAPGPHRCEKINPGTGKPCNTSFSRSYDLTRHEETIHTGRKQKVRCQLCTETKTFSRNDALTRHMRVVHPDVEFSGKSSRRSRG